MNQLLVFIAVACFIASAIVAGLARQWAVCLVAVGLALLAVAGSPVVPA